MTELCSDCPPVGYPTENTRCDACPRRKPPPRLPWSEIANRHILRKYRSRSPIPGWRTKTVRIIDVTLSGDVVISYRGSSSHPVIPQHAFLAWLKSAVRID